MTFFVGRKKEIATILQALEQEQSILIRGKFGMGRTSLVKHIAEMMNGGRLFWFADFSKPPEKMCRRLYGEIFPQGDHSGLNYKMIRRRIVEAALRVTPKVVLVFDNVETVSWSRIELCRYFASSGAFLFIAVVDHSLDSDSTLRLRAVLHLSQQVQLSNLHPAEVAEFFRYYAGKRNYGWSEEQIIAQSRRSRGYPLLMVAAVSKDSQQPMYLKRGVNSHEQD